MPKLTGADVAFGNVDHLPERSEATEPFASGPYADFIEAWFYKGADPARLKPRDGVNKADAIRAIQAALGSFAPKHERKMEGCAFLLHEWFELEPKP